jgi:hypothetical protein
MALNTAGQTLTPASVIYSDGFAKFAEGSVVFDATAITAADYWQVIVGFVPKYFVFHNDTDRTKLEWRDGMAADSAIKTVAAGTVTLEVTGGNRGIVVGTGALTSAPSNVIPGAGQVQVSQNATLAAILASKTIRWSAWG